jgi:hypothetical protein
VDLRRDSKVLDFDFDTTNPGSLAQRNKAAFEEMANLPTPTLRSQYIVRDYETPEQND